MKFSQGRTVLTLKKKLSWISANSFSILYSLNFHNFWCSQKKHFQLLTQQLYDLLFLTISTISDVVHLSESDQSEVWYPRGVFVGQGNLLLIYICNFHVLNHLLLIYILKLHWNLNAMFVCQVNYFWFTYEISMS